MWQRFTERARFAILLAQEDATNLKAHEVDVHHILLGLLRESEGYAAIVLQKAGISPEGVRQAILAKAPPSTQAPGHTPELTPRAKRVLERSSDEAHRFGHEHIGTEHMLLAVIGTQDDVAAAILRDAGITLEDARQLVATYLEPATTHTPEPTSDAGKNWIRFTQRSRDVILAAQQTAINNKSPHVGVEHLLSCLLTEGEGTGARTLRQFDVTPEKIRAELAALPNTPGAPTEDGPILSPEAKRTLEIAGHEAQQMQHNHVGTGHLLLGLLAQEESSAALVLNKLGVTLEDARRAVMELENNK